MKPEDKIRKAVLEILNSKSKVIPLYEGGDVNAVEENYYDDVADEVVKFISFNFPVMRSFCDHQYKDYGEGQIDVCTKCNSWKWGD